jgi:hypothetical protein
VKANKGRTSVIIYTDDYNKKVHDFLNNNNFKKTPKRPTNKYQKLISTYIQQNTSPRKNPNHHSSRHRLKYTNQETLSHPS